MRTPRARLSAVTAGSMETRERLPSFGYRRAEHTQHAAHIIRHGHPILLGTPHAHTHRTRRCEGGDLILTISRPRCPTAIDRTCGRVSACRCVHVQAISAHVQEPRRLGPARGRSLRVSHPAAITNDM